MAYKNQVTVACVNFRAEWGEKAARLEKIKVQIRQAARLGAELIVFPELALSGYQCDNTERCRMHEEAAETVPGPSTEEVAKIAADLGVYVVLGMPERDKEDPKIRYNAAAVVGPSGILGTYRKLHEDPFPAQRTPGCITPGSQIPVWETEFGPFGVLCSYDMHLMPEVARIMALKGARLLVSAAGSGAGPAKKEFFTRQNVARATENFVYIAVANLVGQEKDLNFLGCSTIAGPTISRFCDVLAQAADAEEIITATVNFRTVALWNQEIINWKAQRQTKLFLDEFSRLARQV